MFTPIVVGIPILTFFFYNVYNDMQSLSQSCKSEETCGRCLSSSAHCMWCGNSDNFTAESLSFTSCISVLESNAEWRNTCGANYIFNPQSEVIVVKDTKFTEVAEFSSSFSFDEDAMVTQLTPQQTKLALRVGKTENINVAFRKVNNYPVDVYILIGLSNGLGEVKDALPDLAHHLLEDMQEFTQNMRLGFGTFLDATEEMINPYDGCQHPFTFKNILDISDDASSFDYDTDASITVNPPEAGLYKSIFQAMMCQRLVGWRDGARRILIVVTDASVHQILAEDKKSLVLPESEGIENYPSHQQLNKAVIEGNTQLIFAFTSEESRESASTLPSLIGGLVITSMANDLSDLNEVTRREYRGISNRVQFVDSSVSPVFIDYWSNCNGGFFGSEWKTSVCDDVDVGQEVAFRIEVGIHYCSSYRNLRKKKITISPVGFPDTLQLDLQMICDCSYSKSLEAAVSSLSTPSRTSFEVAPASPLDEQCRVNASERECSGRGTCVEGGCVCDRRDNPQEVVTGMHCECTNFMCDYSRGAICSGPDRGTCECSQCRCKPGWTGSACHCEDSVDNCRNPETLEICSNHGKCECNSCLCQRDGGYAGKFCEHCPTCPTKCSMLKSCVQCQAYGSGSKTPEECQRDCSFFKVRKMASVKAGCPCESGSRLSLTG